MRFLRNYVTPIPSIYLNYQMCCYCYRRWFSICR